jgi:tetraacyldisaccharide 4'-kinase
MLRALLYPFAILYDVITRVRNYLYDTGRRGSVKFDANVIAVGNLAVGGTGKTPQVEYLIRLLKEQYKVATLSRGYGRKTKGFLLADESSSATTIGDEPFQYYQKFGHEITVAVGEERAIAIPSILLERPETQVILLDDAYQHRAVRPSFSILLSDYSKPFYKDYVLPAGRLREARKGAERADVIIITKCPEALLEEELQNIKNKVNYYSNKDVAIFFTGIKYGEPINIFDKSLSAKDKKMVLFTGLANPESLINYIEKTYVLSEHIEYPDHYFYKTKDIESILSTFNALNGKNDHILLTTEKDMVKLLDPLFKKQLQNVSLFYIPIEIYFLREKEKFDQLIFKKALVF